jgi:uncharacterized repeat protein (TIGR02543 family)
MENKKHFLLVCLLFLGCIIPARATNYTLTLATNGLGGIALNPSGGSYGSNTTVTATATPSAGWVFAGWTGAAGGTGNPISFAVDTNETLTGAFAPAGTTTAMTSPSQASLQAAIAAGGWVWLGFTGTLTLTNTINITNNNVILDGTGVAATISGGNAVQLFNVAQGASLTISNLTLANGSCISANGTANGGAIYNNGTLMVFGCTFTNNTAQSQMSGGMAYGGAVYDNGGTMVLSDSSFLSNNVSGGLPNQGGANGGFGYGGAIYMTTGLVTMANCILNGNICNSYGPAIGNDGASYGGALYEGAGTVNIANTIFSANEVIGGIGSFYAGDNSGYGGAISINGGTMTMSGSQMTANVAHGEACWGGACYQSSGSLVVSNCSFSFNAITNTGNGFAVSAGGAIGGSGNMMISFSQFTGNKASGGNGGGTGCPAGGGAIYSLGMLTLNDSSFMGNLATADSSSFGAKSGNASASGGAFYNGGTAVLNRCLFCSNLAQGGPYNYASSEPTSLAGYGGGIFNASQLSATNCTIVLNTTIGGVIDNGHISGPALGGGIYNGSSAAIVAMGLTIASNNCYAPFSTNPNNGGPCAGAQIANVNGNGTFHVHNTLIAYPGTDIEYESGVVLMLVTNSNAYGPITDDGYNMCSDGSAEFSAGSSYSSTDPRLQPLGNYGGLTLCMPLLAGGPAIGKADPSDYPPVDQRGYLRPGIGGPDMGAYEYGTAPVRPVMAVSSSNNNALISFTLGATNPYVLQRSTDLKTWQNISTNGGMYTATNISQSINRLAFPQAYFRLLMQ